MGNITVLLKHIADETARKRALPSQGDVEKEGDDLKFKQQQLANAEHTTGRLDVELQERKLDLERVEELERKMTQEMENLTQKMNEMRSEIKIYSDLEAVESSAVEEKANLSQRKAMLQANCQQLQQQVESRRKVLDNKRAAS